MRVYGYNPDVDTEDEVDVWEGGTIYPFPAVAAETAVVSSSEHDADDGPAAWAVCVQGLDDEFSPAEEIVTLAGTTPIVLDNDFLRINSVSTHGGGRAAPNWGSISVTIGGVEVAVILPGVACSRMAVYTVPVGYEAVVTRWNVSAGQEAKVTAGLYTRAYSGDFILRDERTDIYQNPAECYFSVSLALAAKTDIVVRCIAEEENKPVAAWFDLMLRKE